MIDFTNIEYLKDGNSRQQKAYKALKALGIFEELQVYKPLLTGTIPIEIDLPESDLDVVCECDNHAEFAEHLSKLFANKKGFVLESFECYGILATTAKFESNGFEIEIFGQNIPTKQQNAYRHMLIEHKILTRKGTEFRDKIKQLKSDGLKTEPAFAKLLGLNGNPYEELLKFEID